NYAAGAYSDRVVALDADGDVLTYRLIASPTGMAIDPSSGAISWLTKPTDVGDHTVTVQVDDGKGGKDTQNFQIHVAASPPADISGTVFDDLDRDGTQGPTEPGVQRWDVFLDLDHNGRIDPGEPLTTTDQDGRYTFRDVAPGSYRVTEASNADWIRT